MEKKQEERKTIGHHVDGDVVPAAEIRRMATEYAAKDMQDYIDMKIREKLESIKRKAEAKSRREEVPFKYREPIRAADNMIIADHKIISIKDLNKIIDEELEK